MSTFGPYYSVLVLYNEKIPYQESTHQNTPKEYIPKFVGSTNEDPPATMQLNTSEYNLETINDAYNNNMDSEFLPEVHQQQTMEISNSSLNNDKVGGELVLKSAISIELDLPCQWQQKFRPT